MGNLASKLGTKISTLCRRLRHEPPLRHKIFFTAQILLSSGFYIFDVATDIYLASGYFYNQQPWWGALSTAFIVAPATATFALAWYVGSSKTEKFFAAVNVIPIYYNAEALKQLLIDDDEEEAMGQAKAAVLFRFPEIFLEAMPQMALQLYIVGKRKKFTRGQYMSVLSSFVSLGLGIANGGNVIMTAYEAHRFESSLRRKVVFKTSFLLWFALHLLTFLPPLALFASITSPGWLALFAYFFLHLILSMFCSFVFPLNEADELDLPCMRLRCKSKASKALSKFASILFQLIFLLLTMYFTLYWFGYLAPEMSKSSIQTLYFQNWCKIQPVLVSSYTQFCKSSAATASAATSTTAVTAATTIAAAAFTADTATATNATAITTANAASAAATIVTTLAATSQPFWPVCGHDKHGSLQLHLHEFCLEHHADVFFVVFFVAIPVLFVYHCVFVALWPTMNDKLFYDDVHSNWVDARLGSEKVVRNQRQRPPSVGREQQQYGYPGLEKKNKRNLNPRREQEEQRYIFSEQEQRQQYGSSEQEERYECPEQEDPEEQQYGNPQQEEEIYDNA